MKKQMLMGLLGILLMSSGAVRADDSGTSGAKNNTAARDEASVGEAVDCFYESNQSNPLCQENKGPQRAAQIGHEPQKVRSSAVMSPPG